MCFLVGPLPKGRHGGEDYNTRTQVIFATFEVFTYEVFIFGLVSFLELAHFFFLYIYLSAGMNIAEAPRVFPVSLQFAAKVSRHLFVQFKVVLRNNNLHDRLKAAV